jgi:hypothetical protein
MVDQKGIERQAKTLVDEIRSYSKEQKSFWNQLPYWALEADGRTGFSDSYSRAYRTGYWAVDKSIINGCYTVYVDLENGELVNAFDPRKKANAIDVLRLAFDLDTLDAASTVEWVKEEAKKPYGSYYKESDRKSTDERRESLRAQFCINPTAYRRKIAKKEVYEANLVAGLVD